MERRPVEHMDVHKAQWGIPGCLQTYSWGLFFVNWEIGESSRNGKIFKKLTVKRTVIYIEKYKLKNNI